MNKWKIALHWFCGVNLTFICTALPIVLALVALTYGIRPETLSGLVSAWFFGSLIIAILPALMIGLDVADDQMILYFAETGQQMVRYLNVFAWLAWFVILFWILDHRLFPPDEKENQEA